MEAIGNLKKGKRDASNLDSTHFVVAAPVISDVLVLFFTALLHHGFLPQIIDCLLVPVPKPGKSLSHSDSYRSIALASSLSKILEWCIILIQYVSHLDSCNLQFGFRKDLSTTLCTGVLKQVARLQLSR